MIPQLQREAPVSGSDAPPRWSLAARIAFRFVFCYFLLYVGPGPVGSLSPYKQLDTISPNVWQTVWHQVVPWVGSNLFHLNPNSLTEVANGSGDEVYDYVLIFCLIVTAAIATAIWSVLDRKRQNYRQLNQWLRLLVRMTVGWGMLGYGVKKLIGAQFPPPTLGRLIEPFGQASPLGLLWTFMGASPAYSLFGGLGETLGGVLIVLPGLTTLGSLVSAAMMTNVLMLNLCYDVPRKIFSFHLILICLFLLIPDFRRLANVLIFNRRADPVPEIPLFKDKLLNRAAYLLPIAFGIIILLIAGTQSIKDAKDLRAALPAPIRGIWSVKELDIDGVPRAPLLTDDSRWRAVIFDAPQVLIIQAMDGKQNKYYMQLDNSQRTATLWNVKDPRWKATLAIEVPDNNSMTLNGQFGSHRVDAKLDRVDLSDPDKFPLVNRGFHWVNPFVNNQ